MVDKPVMDSVPDGFGDMDVNAKDWWLGNDGLSLLGQVGGVTVYVVEFEDQCLYFGYTRLGVFTRLAQLLGGEYGWGASELVASHCREMVYSVRCIASGLDPYRARRFRDLLVSTAPSEYGGTVSSAMVVSWMPASGM